MWNRPSTPKLKAEQYNIRAKTTLEKKARALRLEPMFETLSFWHSPFVCLFVVLYSLRLSSDVKEKVDLYPFGYGDGQVYHIYHVFVDKRACYAYSLQAILESVFRALRSRFTWCAFDQFASAIQKLYLQHCTHARRTVMYDGAVQVPRDFVKEMAE
jgi:hypothetical protein